MDDIKRCSKCDIEKELSEFNFLHRNIEINIEIVLN